MRWIRCLFNIYVQDSVIPPNHGGQTFTSTRGCGTTEKNPGCGVKKMNYNLNYRGFVFL